MTGAVARARRRPRAARRGPARARAVGRARWRAGPWVRVAECLTYLPLRSDTKLKLPYYAKIVRHGMAYCCLQAPAPGSSTSSFGSCPARHTGICLEVAGAQGRRGAGAQGRRGAGAQGRRGAGAQGPRVRRGRRVSKRVMGGAPSGTSTFPSPSSPPSPNCVRGTAACGGARAW